MYEAVTIAMENDLLHGSASTACKPFLDSCCKT